MLKNSVKKNNFFEVFKNDENRWKNVKIVFFKDSDFYILAFPSGLNGDF